MKSTPKLRRQRVIMNLLHANPDITITEISDLVPGVNRKTVERDVIELVKEGMITGTDATPSRYSLYRELEIPVAMTLTEISTLMDILGNRAKGIRRKIYNALVNHQGS